MSQNKSTPFLVMDAKNLTLIDATRENSPWWEDICKMAKIPQFPYEFKKSPGCPEFMKIQN